MERERKFRMCNATQHSPKKGDYIYGVLDVMDCLRDQLKYN